MASKYYEWLARDVKPDEPPRELTPAEKRRNWWHYHKWQVLIGVICIWLLGDFIWSMVDAKLNTPDYTIAYVGATQLPNDTLSAIETAFAAFGEDITDNGKVQVRIQQYIQSDGEVSDLTQLEQTAEREYATAVQLMTNIQTAESVIFLLETPEAFQAEYGIVAESVLWAECPVLTGLDLGNYVLTGLMTPVEGSNQELLSRFTLALRSFDNNEESPAIFAAGQLFAELTEGAQ